MLESLLMRADYTLYSSLYVEGNYLPSFELRKLLILYIYNGLQSLGYFFSVFNNFLDEEEDEEDLPDHVDLGLILPKLSNLTHLELCFAVKDVGMNFEWGFFTFTLKDADMLGKR